MICFIRGELCSLPTDGAGGPGRQMTDRGADPGTGCRSVGSGLGAELARLVVPLGARMKSGPSSVIGRAHVCLSPLHSGVTGRAC